MNIKFSKSTQFEKELLNFKERKTDIYTVIKIILEIDITKYGTSYDCSMIAEIFLKKDQEVLYVVYNVKKASKNKINIHFDRFGNKREYKNSLK